MNNRCLLIGDIGGTNARFALANPEEPGFHSVRELQCADFPTADDAIKYYLDEVNAATPDAVCLAAAGPVIDDHIHVTNNHWDVSAADTRADFGIEQVRLLNDFAAIAYSIPFLADDDVLNIGPHDQRRLPLERFNV